MFARGTCFSMSPPNSRFPAPTRARGMTASKKAMWTHSRGRPFTVDGTLQDLLPKSGHRQLDRQVCRLIMLVDHGIHFDDLEARHATVIGDDLHSKVSLSVRSTTAHGSPNSRRVFRVDPVHIKRHVITGRTASHCAQCLFHHRTHAPLIDVAHRVYLGDTGSANVFLLGLIDIANAD